MPAYVITDAVVTDPVQYEEYKKLSGPSLAAYGGKFLVRGGAAGTLEGEWAPNRIVVVEFPDIATAKAWYDGPEYAEARRKRQGAATFRMIFVEGV